MTMPKDEGVYLGHMLDRARKIIYKMDIDEDVVWNVATRHLPTLVEQIERLVPEEPTD
jgi:uncharacterized protein with HEPN domain